MEIPIYLGKIPILEFSNTLEASDVNGCMKALSVPGGLVKNDMPS